MHRLDTFRTFLLWRLLERLQRALVFFRPVTVWIGDALAVAFRIRFALGFAVAGSFALATRQGREIIATSLDTTAEGQTFAFASVLAAFSVWYSSRFLFETWTRDQHPAAEAGGHLAFLREWSPRVLGAAVVGIPAISIWQMSDQLGPNLSASFLAALMAALSISFLFFTANRRDWLGLQAPGRIAASAQDPSKHVSSSLSTIAKLGKLSTSMRIFLGLMLLLNLLTLLVLWAFPEWMRKIDGGAGVSVMLGIALSIVVGSLLVYLADETRVPLFALIFLAIAIFSLWNDNHEVRLEESRTASQLRERTLEQYLDARIGPQVERACAGKQINDCDARVPVIVVAAEGGGVRAAAWTGRVLAGIDAALADRPESERLPSRLIGISGVSGGSLGAAVYLAAHAERSHGYSQRVIDRTHDYFAQTDLMSPVLTSMLFTDNAQRFLPVALPKAWAEDRGTTFERTIEAAWERSGTGDGRNPFSEPFERMWSGENSDLPLLLANTTVVGSGERMVQAPIRLDGPTLGAPFASAIDAATCWGGRSLRLSGVVHNSARFTWVSPAGRYSGTSACDGVRVVDGGYFENSGAATASDLVTAIMQLYGRNVRPIVVQIRNEPLPDGHFPKSCAHGVEDAEPSTQAHAIQAGPHYPLAELGDPLLALLNGRVARGEQSRSALRSRICADAWRGAFVEFALQTSDDADFPLHWSIAAHTLREMDGQFDRAGGGNQGALRELIQALTTPSPAVTTVSAAAIAATTRHAPTVATDADTPTPAPNQAKPSAAKPAWTREAREERRRALEPVLHFSDAMRDLCLAALGGTIVLVLGSSMRRPQGLRARAGFLWLLPGWAALTSALQKWIQVHQHYLALALSPRSSPDNVTRAINEAIYTQILHTSAAMAFIGVWLLTYLIWWVFHRRPEETQA